MNCKDENLYVVTGGPGVGKTTLLKELNNCGFLTIPEDARKIIKEQIAIDGNGLPWKDQEIYGKLMLEASVKTYQNIKSKQREQITFFDRGIIDTFCYFEMESIPIPPEMEELAFKKPYNKNVFILPPWRKIYTTDTERKQTWEQAKLTFDIMTETYLKYNYNVIEVPKQNIEKRREFILGNLNVK